MKGLVIEPISRDELRVHFDLGVHVWERKGEIELYWLYNRDLFDRWRIEQMARHYLRTLETVIKDAGRQIRDIDMLEPEERQKLLEGWNLINSE
jgi:non-ribosomal peptide synthetase component F